MKRILEVDQLETAYRGKHGITKVVDGVSFHINEGETVCIVGESGSGKSVTSLSVMRLVEFENGQLLNGKIMFRGEDLANKSLNEMRKIRGKEMAMVFQEPLTALNPVFTVGKQIAEAIQFHYPLSKKVALEKAELLLNQVGISEPKTRLKQYPHELSGGMRQRVMIAIALACEPNLLIADEPTTALDVTIEAQILELLRSLRSERNMAIMLITHDIGVAAEMADRLIIMYAGKIMEEGRTNDLFDRPRHPYTKGLLESVPSMDGERGIPLKSIKGSIPGLHQVPEGCRFAPRCEIATKKCLSEQPPLTVDQFGSVACWHTDLVVSDEVGK